jgi:hypothetical protein
MLHVLEATGKACSPFFEVKIENKSRNKATKLAQKKM